ncbi:MAG: transcriptional regulator [Rhodospirillaceae bacterium]|nr:transcriptional regulator [Rhodospirillaceae bacterium]
MSAKKSNVVTFGVASIEDTKARMKRAFSGLSQGSFINFVSVELMWKVLTPKRWGIVQAMTGAGPLAIRELARRVERDVKSVHGDVQALLKAGVIRRAPDGRVVFPFDHVRVEFEVKAA